MPLCILTYTGLLYETFVRSGDLLPNGKLPPVLPVVLYNGKPKWTCSSHISDLIEHISYDLDKYLPHSSFLLIDEGTMEINGQISPAMRESRNLVAALFALENAANKRAILNVVDEMLQWLRLPEQQSLSRAPAGWFDRVLHPSRKNMNDIPAFADLTEVSTMLRETVQGWYEEAERKGLAAGMEKGMEKEKVQIACAMKAANEPVEKIEKYTGLSKEIIEKL